MLFELTPISNALTQGLRNIDNVIKEGYSLLITSIDEVIKEVRSMTMEDWVVIAIAGGSSLSTIGYNMDEDGIFYIIGSSREPANLSDFSGGI